MTLSDTALRRLAWAIFLLSLLGVVVSLLLDRASHYRSDSGFAVILFTFPLVGFIVLRKRPGRRWSG